VKRHQPVMWVAKCFQQRLGPLQSKLCGSGRARKQIAERVTVCAQTDDHPLADGMPLICRSRVPTVFLRSFR
jgi:hypothetical protein